MTRHTDYEFNNDASQAEKRRVLRNDRANTFAGIQETIDAEGSGRFSKHTTDTGSQPYPRAALPAWHVQLPPEPPLGIDVNAVPVVGEHFEVEASIKAKSDG
jgi:hypothetical protein